MPEPRSAGGGEVNWKMTNKTLGPFEICPRCGDQYCDGNCPDDGEDQDAVERWLEDKMVVEQASEAIGKLTDLLNRHDEKLIERGIQIALLRTHRTLQQAYFRRAVIVALLLFQQMGRLNHFDLRNEGSIEAAKRMLEAVKDKLYLPLI